jgi:predicted porin
MKKNLLMLAVLGMSGAAFAQSSVTLFGVADATLARGTGSISSKTALSRGGLSSNRIGFRGVEDLGGGLSAQFWLEMGYNLDDGEGQQTNSNNQASGTGAAVAGRQGFTFARRSTVSLASTQWGEIRLGRDFVPQYWNILAADPFGEVGVGSTINFTNIITGPASTRASNQIQYFTPATLGGFAVNYGHYFGENISGTATSKDGTGDGLRIYYTGSVISGGIATSRTKYAAGDVRQSNVNISGMAGPVKLMATLVRDRSGALQAKGGELGASMPVGPQEFKAGYSWYKLNSAGSPEGKKFAIGYVYNLSKRTALYTTLARVKNSGGAAYALNGAVTAANQSSSGLDLGIRHSF